MDQDLDKKIDFKIKLISIFKKHKIKFISLTTIILITLVTFFVFIEKKKRKNVLLAEKYIKAGILLSNEKISEAKNSYEEIIFENNEFYSLLALNQVLEKKLINNKSKILEYFLELEKKTTSSNLADLILFKKALYLMKNDEIESGTTILNNLINKKSNLKSAAEEIIK